MNIGAAHQDQPFFLHVTYTAPHFPLHARPAEIAKYRGKYQDGWDAERARRYERLKHFGIINPADGSSRRATRWHEPGLTCRRQGRVGLAHGCSMPRWWIAWIRASVASSRP